MRNAPSNVRVGPGTQYDIAYTFLRAGVPVEIIQEFDTWRKIRDVDGDEGWVHQNLVVGTRTALVRPAGSDPIALRAGSAPDSAVRAWLSANMLVGVRQCDGTVCEIALDHQANGKTTSYRGYLDQSVLWGVYPGEIVE